jgi:hypothetical protein
METVTLDISDIPGSIILISATFLIRYCVHGWEYRGAVFACQWIFIRRDSMIWIDQPLILGASV